MMWMKFDVLQKHPRQARARFTRRARAIGASPLEAPKIGVQAVIVGSDARALTVHGDTRVSLRHDLAAPDLWSQHCRIAVSETTMVKRLLRQPRNRQGFWLAHGGCSCSGAGSMNTDAGGKSRASRIQAPNDALAIAQLGQPATCQMRMLKKSIVEGDGGRKLDLMHQIGTYHDNVRFRVSKPVIT